MSTDEVKDIQIQKLKEEVAYCEAYIDSLKAEIDRLREWNKRYREVIGFKDDLGEENGGGETGVGGSVDA